MAELHRMSCGGAKVHLGDHPGLTLCGMGGWRIKPHRQAKDPLCKRCERVSANRSKGETTDD